VDRGIEGRRWGCGIGGRVVAEEEDSTGAGAGVGFGEIGGVTMDVEAHLAIVVLDGGIRMGGGVVEKMDSCFGGGLHAMGLCGSKAAKCNKHSVIDGSSIVKKNANDFL
jgi:hypothetical protein